MADAKKSLKILRKAVGKFFNICRCYNQTVSIRNHSVNSFVQETRWQKSLEFRSMIISIRKNTLSTLFSQDKLHFRIAVFNEKESSFAGASFLMEAN